MNAVAKTEENVEVVIWLTPEQADNLHRLSRARAVSVSELVQEALTYLDTELFVC